MTDILPAHKALIEAALAEALHAHNKGTYSEQANLNAARNILATPDGSTLARWAAIGEAVERLPDYWLVSRYDGQWHIHNGVVGAECKGHSDTLPAAISAALGEP